MSNTYRRNGDYDQPGTSRRNKDPRRKLRLQAQHTRTALQANLDELFNPQKNPLDNSPVAVYGSSHRLRNTGG